MDNSLDSPRPQTESEPLLEGRSTTPDSSCPRNYDSISCSRPPTSTSVFSWAVTCILVTELCERLTYFGISANLVLFAKEESQLNFTAPEATVLAFLFQGTSCTLPLLGGWLGDSVSGKFSVIFYSLIIYFIGAALLPVGALSHKDRYTMWADSILTSTTFKQTIYIFGLLLVAFGTSGIKANASPFGAEQVSNRNPGAIQVFFAWFYWFINIGSLLAFTFVVYVQQEISFFYGLLIPAISTILTLIIFRAGKRTYRIHPPAGSVISNIVNIVKEAVKKSRRPVSASLLVSHWLDRAKASFGGSHTSWEVEDVKKFYLLMPIFGALILYWTVFNQMSTSMVIQGQYMNIMLGSSFEIPVASLQILDSIGVLVLIPVMDRLVYPLLSKFNIHLSQLQRVGIGMIILTMTMICAGGLELYRVDQCCILQKRTLSNYTVVSNISIFYQVPQYALISLSEVFTAVTGLELAYSEAPKSFQSILMGFFILTMGLGAYVGAAVVAIVNLISGRHSDEDKWYPDKRNINGGKLANYFFLLAGLMAINFILYVFVANSFKAKKDAAKHRNASANNVLSLTQDSIPKPETFNEQGCLEHTSSC